MRAYLHLFRRFTWRALTRSPLRSFITVLGISLGVAVMIAIRLANAGALESFRAATRQIAGETSLQITGVAGRFDEMLLIDLGWLRNYGQVSPVVTGFATISGQQEEFLQVIGIDILRDRALRSYKLIGLSGETEPNAREFLLLLTDPQSIVLTEKFARPRGLDVGSPIDLVIGDTQRSFIVRGLLAYEGPARALDGRVAIVDIARAQEALGRTGLIDRLDVKLRKSVSTEQAEREVAERLPSQLRVTRPENSYGQVEKLIAAFHFNLNALASIALLVGLFLIYNTISVSVITRREEIGSLRAIGAGRRLVLSLFLSEAAMLSVVGAAAGLLIGRAFANFAVRATSTTVENFYIARAATDTITSHSIGIREVLLAFSVAIALSLVAAAVPAIEASRVSAIEAMRGAERLARSFRPSLKHLAIALALAGIGYLMSRFDAIGGLPVFGYASALAFMFGGAALVPNALWLVCKASDRLSWLSVLQVERKTASANLRGSISRVSISVAALSVSLAMMTAVAIMVSSFRETVVYWIDQTLTADIYAKPATRATSMAEGEISDEALAAIKSHPEVAATDSFTAMQVSFGDDLITIAAGDFSVLLDHGRLLFKSPSDARARIRQAIGADSVVISESFSLRFNKRPGDEVELPTRAGPSSFSVAAVYYNYSETRGVAVMDRRTFEKYFNRAGPSSLSIYLKEGADAESVSQALAGATARARLVFTTNASARREVIRIFDNTFSITWALELIAITIAGLGVISTLIALILERRGELALLRFLGATRAQIRRMVVIEAVLIGGVSQLTGIAIGFAVSLVLIYVMNVQSFGWTIQFHFPVMFLIQSTLLTLAVTAVAGLYPASRAARVEAVRFAREE